MKLKADWNQILYHLNWYCWFLALSCGTLPIWIYFRFMKLEGISVIPKWIVLLIPLGLLALHSYEKNRQKGILPYLFSLTFILITGFFVLKNTPQFGNDYLWVYLYHALKKGIVGVIGIRFLFHSEANKNLPQDYILEIVGVILLLLPLIMTMTLPWFWILVLAVIGEICITNRKKEIQQN